ncbi:MAG: glycosyltransferase family 2 protein [Pseudomonadota bacterium]
MQLKEITGLLITFNEARNIERTLDALQRLSRVIVVDSGSTDETLEILRQYGNCEVVHRTFDDFASQRNFGLERIETPWVLSLDADHRVSDGFLPALTTLPEKPNEAAFDAPFEYHIFGRALRGSILPSRPVLFRRTFCHYVPDGHSERLVIDGSVGRLQTPIEHDDRKSLGRWFTAQARYAEQEAEKLLAPDRQLGLRDRVRRWVIVAPVVVPIITLLRGGILDGWRGWYYALQRGIAEAMQALAILDRRFRMPTVRREPLE